MEKKKNGHTTVSNAASANAITREDHLISQNSMMGSKQIHWVLRWEHFSFAYMRLPKQNPSLLFYFADYKLHKYKISFASIHVDQRSSTGILQGIASFVAVLKVVKINRGLDPFMRKTL